MSNINSENLTISSNYSTWQKLNLRTKSIIVAIALGTIPVMAISSIAYSVASRSISGQIMTAEQDTASEVANKVAFYMRERYGDIQIMSGLAILTNPKIRNATSTQEKQVVLNQFIKAYIIYDSIAAFDLNGNVIAQSSGEPLSNHKNESYFQEALKTNSPIISQPIFSQKAKTFYLYTAAPIKDHVTGKTIGIMRARIPAKYLRDVILADQRESNYLLNNRGEIFAASEEQEHQKIQTGDSNIIKGESWFSAFGQLKQKNTINTVISQEKLVSYIPFAGFKDEFRSQLPNIGWSVISTVDENVAFAPQRQLIFTFILGTTLVAIGTGAIAIYLANRATRPIIDAAETLQQIGEGNFNVRIPVQGEDELAQLGHNINSMTEQIQNLLQVQEQEVLVRQQMMIEKQIAAEQKEQNQQLQQELFQFLNSIEGASSGDLTVRAEINDGEIGIVADFFNSIIESLRDIVLQVQQATSKVSTSIGDNEHQIREVAEEALKQTTHISQTLNAVEEMTHSIQQVANNAQAAAEVSRTASLTATTGGEAIDKTVQSILQLRETVAATAKKVKRLGESSQEISKVVSLINQIAMQTNMLAINASIEASRAGEEGRGFAVVAEEVGELALKSAEATKEIEEIVETIQEETAEVVNAMEIGTAQVVEGTRLVEDTKNSLDQIVQVSRKIDLLLQSISTATISQAQTSSVVTELMENIAQASERTSSASTKVSQSLETTVEIAQKLQASVGAFKV